MATLDLIESMSKFRRGMTGVSYHKSHDDHIRYRREILGLLRRLSTETIDEESMRALRSELPKLFPLDIDFHGFVLDLYETLGPPDEAARELFLRILDARDDRQSPYRIARGEYIPLLRLLESIDSPMPAVLGPLQILFDTDPEEEAVSVQDTELQLRAAGLLLERDGPARIGAALDRRCASPSFRARLVKLMTAEKDWRIHGISSPAEMADILMRLSGASRPFARLVDRYHDRIRRGETILPCPGCGEYGVFVTYLGIPTETIRERVRCELCGTSLILTITEAVQAPGHEEHSRTRFALELTD